MTIDKIQLTESLHKKFQEKLVKFDLEGVNIPFQSALLGEDRTALYSLTHSVSTALGGYHEIVAKLIAPDEFDVVHTQKKLSETITVQAQTRISEILNSLSMQARRPNHDKEIEEIREVCRTGQTTKVSSTKVDIWLEKDNVVYMIDLKTAKPNTSDWDKYKRTLLTWAAKFLYEEPKSKIRSIIGIPYNPYEPKSYSHWTEKGILDLSSGSKQLLIGQELWSFLSGQEDAMDILIECYKEVGERNASRITEIYNEVSLRNALER
ncbi:MAG: TdeIII family type II restriction endonuclease [Gammaproteobacteria bacterium]|nr:TdeIII family type II restriction endonuclease [Gammaproteobacteria bacterium]